VIRRRFLLGLGAGLITAPAIVRAASLMPVRAIAAAPDQLTNQLLLDLVRTMRDMQQPRWGVDTPEVVVALLHPEHAGIAWRFLAANVHVIVQQPIPLAPWQEGPWNA
jgi:hypothetical protein